MIIVEQGPDRSSTSQSIFDAAMADKDDFTGGIAIEGTSYLALFTITPLEEEDQYSVTDFLIDGEDGILLAVDDEMSDVYNKDDTLSMISHRLGLIED